MRAWVHGRLHADFLRIIETRRSRGLASRCEQETGECERELGRARTRTSKGLDARIPMAPPSQPAMRSSTRAGSLWWVPEVEACAAELELGPELELEAGEDAIATAAA